MRIGIDARELSGRATGVGRYLAGLLTRWAEADAARRHEFVLYSPTPLTAALDAHRFATRLVPGTSGTVWEQLLMPKIAARDHLDVFFSPGYTAPLFRRIPTVVAIHDVSFAAHPEWFALREGARRRWLTRRTAAEARAVITISEFSRRELIDRLGVRESIIHVIPPGITLLSGGAAVSSAGSPLGRTFDPPPHSRVLYVGSIFNRRHVPDLIRAFAPIALTHADASLDLVGDNRSYPFEDVSRIITAQGLNRQILWRQYVSDDELRRLYVACRAFAFLSEYEGLGLTPLEALAFGVPPVLLDTPVARESCGTAALYVPHHDVRAITRALEQLLFDEACRAALIAEAPAVLAKYDWPRAARETLTVIESAV
jgi:glycosyltransferase involved in cell wall biosynthesis